MRGGSRVEPPFADPHNQKNNIEVIRFDPNAPQSECLIKIAATDLLQPGEGVAMVVSGPAAPPLSKQPGSFVSSHSL